MKSLAMYAALVVGSALALASSAYALGVLAGCWWKGFKWAAK